MSCTTCAGAIGRLARTPALIATTLRYPYETRDAKEYSSDLPDVKVEPDMLKLAHHILSRARRRISTPRSLWTPIRKPLSLSSRRSRLACRYRACNAAAARMWRTSWMCSAVALQRKKPHQLLRRKKGRQRIEGQSEMLLPIADKKGKQAAAKQPSQQKRPSGKGRLTRAEISKYRQRCRSE